MPSVVNWSIEASIGGGPDLSLSNSFLAEAYSLVEVTVQGGDSATEPFEAAPTADVSLLLISATHYAPTDLTVTLGGVDMALDQPQMHVGAGMLSRFGADISEVTVTNDLADPVTVRLLVGRAAS